MKRILITGLALLLCSISYAEKVVEAYKTSLIKEELLKNAHAVIRMDYGEFDVKNAGSANYHIKFVVTILDKKGDAFSTRRIGYDDINKIGNIDAALYDKNGTLIQKAKKSDIQDYSASNYIHIMDTRVKEIEFNYPYYPYTVEFEYDLEYGNMLFYPDWSFQGIEKVSVEHSQIVIKTPPGIKLDYETHKFDGAFKEYTEEGKKVYSWTMENLPAFEEEDYGPPDYVIYPYINFAPSSFEVQGFLGSLDSWNDLGKWQNLLNQGRQELPPETIAKIKALTKDLPTNEQKIKAIYEYMQSKTRYVSIQLGIGGWQPFEASYVDENGYGDCKALSNYTVALLKAIGIKAHYAIIHGGRDNPIPLKEDFVKRAFNHVIVCVPNEKDTIWLECTSQTEPYGYLGNFTSNRQALLVTENGGKLVTTPKYERDKNCQFRHANVVLSLDQDSEATIHTSYTGLQYENVSRLLNTSTSEQKKLIYKRLDLSDYDIQTFDYSQKKQPLPVANEALELSLHNYGTKSGKRFFFIANLLNRRSPQSAQQRERTYDLYFKFPYVDFDTIQYTLPEGYHVEYLPKGQKLESDFGTYESSYQVVEGQLIYIRKMSKNDGVFPKEKYTDYIDFMNKIADADNEKVVIVKET